MTHQEFLTAAENGDIETVRKGLKSEEIDPNAGSGFFNKENALMKAIKMNQYEVARILLQSKKVNPMHAYNSAFIMVCRRGIIELFRNFMDRDDFNPAFENNEGLITAIEHGNSEIYNVLINDDRVKETNIKIGRFDLLPSQVVNMFLF